MQEIKEAVCVSCSRVYDSCADRDCIADANVIFTSTGQSIIDSANSLKCRSCSVLNCFVDVEEVPFNRGFYSVDINYFFKLVFDAYTTPLAPPTTVEGFATYSKRAILFGSDGRVKTFSSEFASEEFDEQLVSKSTTPVAKVQCAEPIAMDTKLYTPCACTCPHDLAAGIPKCIASKFQGDFVLQNAPRQSVMVTIGLFTIVQLERDVQMLIPAYDFCVPCKECSCDTDDPCDTFRKIQFPLDEFFPPNVCDRGTSIAADFASSKSCGCSD